MSVSSSILQWQEEVRTVARNLPYKALRLGRGGGRRSEPPRIRQARLIGCRPPGTPGFSRFLSESGTVEILPPEKVEALFHEIHWCARRIRTLARQPAPSTRTCRQARIQVRKLMTQIESAETELYMANRRLVVKCVNHYKWIDPAILDDLLQEGSQSLSHAMRKFDFTRGTPFVAYAQKAVQNRLRNCMRDHLRSGILGFKPTADMIAVRDAMATWRTLHPKEPSDVALAELTGIPEARILRARALLHKTSHLPTSIVSLDALAGDNFDTDLYDYIRDPRAVDAARLTQREEVRALVNELPDRERAILRFRFFDGRTLEETGTLMNLTRARIKQIQDRALLRLRGRLSSAPAA